MAQLMTEAKWLACDFPPLMMRHLRRVSQLPYQPPYLSWWGSWFGPNPLPRRWRLFLAACCGRVAPTLGVDSPLQRLVEFAQACTECVPSEEQVQRVQRWFGSETLPQVCQRLLRGLTSPLSSA